MSNFSRGLDILVPPLMSLFLDYIPRVKCHIQYLKYIETYQLYYYIRVLCKENIFYDRKFNVAKNWLSAIAGNETNIERN